MPSRNPTRRRALTVGGLFAAATLGGCAAFGTTDGDTAVDLTVVNRSDVERTVAVTVESDGEVVFEGSYDLPAPEGGARSVTEEDVLTAGQYTVHASNGAVERESRYGGTCEDVEDLEDEILITVRSDSNLEISSTYCGK